MGFILKIVDSNNSLFQALGEVMVCAKGFADLPFGNSYVPATVDECGQKWPLEMVIL